MPSPDDEYPLSVLEEDENVPPRPEEEIADRDRAEPDRGAQPGGR